jgi:hypothetical protein
MYIPVLANEVWFARWIIKFTDTQVTDDLKVDFTFPAGTTHTHTVLNGADQRISFTSTTTCVVPTQTTSVTTAANHAEFEGIIVVSSTAGNFQMRFAHNGTGAGTLTAKVGSTLMAQRMAP